MTDVPVVEGLFDDDFLDDPDDLTFEQVAEIRAGINRGLKAAAEGRVKPLAQVVAEARQRHGFPMTWASRWSKDHALKRTATRRGRHKTPASRS